MGLNLPPAGPPVGYPLGMAPTQSTVAVRPMVYGPGSYTFRAPLSGRYAFRLIGAGGRGSSGANLNTAAGGGSGAYARKTVFLGAGQTVAINVAQNTFTAAAGSASPATTAGLPTGTVSAGSGVNAGSDGVATAGGTASGGDVNVNGAAGTTGNGAGGTATGDTVCGGGAGGASNNSGASGSTGLPGAWPGGGGGGGVNPGPAADGGCIVTYEGP